MSVNPLSSSSDFNLGKLLGNKPPFLEVLTKPNEMLSPTGLLQRVVGLALGTENAARINDFLGQSGLSLHTLPQPSQTENGANSFRFPTPERFWQSIGTFQQTGNALPLTRSIAEFAPAQTPSFAATNPTSVIASKQGVTTQLERARLEPTQTQTKDKKTPLSSNKLIDDKGVTYSGKPDDLKGDEVFGVKVTVKPTDTRESLLAEGNRAAVRAAGYKEPQATRIADARTAQLAEQGVTGIVDVNTKTAGKTGETDDTELKNLRKDGAMSYYVTGAEIKEYDRISNQQQLQDAIAAGKPLTQEMIERSGVDREKLNGLLKEMNWQPVPTFDEAVDKLAAQKKADVLAWQTKAMSGAAIDTNYTNSKWYGMTDAQITAETKREAEGDIKRQVGKGELTLRREDRPDSISATNTPKWQTDAKLMIEKYLPGLADLNSPEGIKTTAVEAFTASFVNARLFGATDFYVDQSRFHNQREQDNAQIMSVAGSMIGELQNLTLAGKTVEAAMATTKVARGIQILKESGAAGKLIAQALPSAATFGGLEAAKETVKNATGNSQGIVPAVANVARATTTGAVFGVLEPLAVGARVPAVAAGSYGVEKVFGASDKEAAMSALTNGLFSIAGGRGRAAEELAGKTIRVTGENGTATNVKVTVDTGKRVVLTEVAANVKADLQVKVSQLKERLRGIGIAEGNNSQATREQAIRNLGEGRQSARIGGNNILGQPELATVNGAPANILSNTSNIKGSNVLESRAYPKYPDLQLPVSNGTWRGEPGNSGWLSGKESVNNVTKGEPIPFKDGYVDFSKWSKGDVTLESVTGDNKKDFPAADKLFAEQKGLLKKNGEPNAAEVFRYRTKEKLTWHHVPNTNRMELIPTELHSNIPHTGSASQNRNAVKGENE